MPESQSQLSKPQKPFSYYKDLAVATRFLFLYVSRQDSESALNELKEIKDVPTQDKAKSCIGIVSPKCNFSKHFTPT